MKITFESEISIHDENYQEITLYFIDNVSAKKTLALKEIVPKTYSIDGKYLIKRTIDNMFYELKRKVMEEFERLNQTA